MGSKQGAGCIALGALLLVVGCLVFSALIVSLVVTGEIPQGAPRIVEMGPAEPGAVRPMMAVSVAFDQPMDPGSVAVALSVQPPLSGTLSWNEDRSVVTLMPKAPGFETGRFYSVRLAPGVRAGRLPRKTRNGAVHELWLPELVERSDPERGAAMLGPWTELSASFNYTLSCHATLRTFSIVPHHDGLLECRGGRVGFSPRQPLAPSTRYVATLGQVYLLGESWGRPGIRWEFSTADPLTVAEVRPSTPGYLVDLWTPVEVAFNRPVVTDSVSSRFALVRTGGVAVSGRLHWNRSATAFTFQPDQPLMPGNDYRFLLEAGVSDLLGYELGEAVEGRFVTLHMMGLPLPAPGSRQIRLDSSLRLPFTRPMDRPSVQSALVFEPALHGEVGWIEDTLVFTPWHGLAPETVYEVTLDASARDATGAPMGQERRWAFESGPLLLEARVPLETDAGADRPLTFQFALPMDKTSVEAALTTTPATPGEFLWPDDRTMVFQPDSGWLSGQEYRIALAGSVRSVGGHYSLGHDLSWSFATHGPDPQPGD